MTNEEIQEQRLQNFIDAEEKALEAQEYQKKDFRARRADLGAISTGLDKILSENGTRSRSRSRRIILTDR
jgi:hypothetical protein